MLLGWHTLHSAGPPPPPSTKSPAPVILNATSNPLVSSLIVSGLLALNKPTNFVIPLQVVVVSNRSFVKTA